MGGRCFVATACLGDERHPTVLTLRQFRDRVLRRSAAGRSFLAWYVRNGPRLAEVTAAHPRLLICLRIGLNILAWVLRATVPGLRCQKPENGCGIAPASVAPADGRGSPSRHGRGDGRLKADS